jgi:hypothetical protein
VPDVGEVLHSDWFRGGIKRERLGFLTGFASEFPAPQTTKPTPAKRQKRHLSH